MTKRFVAKGYSVTDSLKNEEIYEFKSHQESIDVADILNKICQDLDAEVEYYKRQFKEGEKKLLQEQRMNLKLKLINDNIRKCLDGV